MAEPDINVTSIEPRIDLGRSGIIRTVESLSEQEQQNILTAIAKTKDDFAKLYTKYVFGINPGLIPTHDELGQGFTRDISDFAKLANNHNYAMGGHYSALGVAWRETPLNLITVPLDFLRAINFEGKKENHAEKITALDKYDAQEKKRINDEANNRHYQHRFQSKGGGVDTDALNNTLTEMIDNKMGQYATTKDIEDLKSRLNDMDKGIKDEILKSLPKQQAPLDEADLKRILDEKMNAYLEDLQGSPQDISTSVKNTFGYAEGRLNKHLPKKDETEYMKESRVYIDAYEAGVKFTKELYDGHIPKEVFIKENDMILGTLDMITNILEVATAEGRLEKDSERYKEMTNYIDILKKAAEKEKGQFKEKKPGIKEHDYGWMAYF